MAAISGCPCAPIAEIGGHIFMEEAMPWWRNKIVLRNKPFDVKDLDIAYENACVAFREDEKSTQEVDQVDVRKGPPDVGAEMYRVTLQLEALQSRVLALQARIEEMMEYLRKMGLEKWEEDAKTS